MIRDPVVLRRKQAATALRAVVTHYTRAGAGPLSAPVPPELQSAADLLRSLDGLSVTRLLLENQSTLPLWGSR